MNKIGIVIRETWIRQVKSVSFCMMVLAPLIAIALNFFVIHGASGQFQSSSSSERIAYVVSDKRVPYQGVVKNTSLETAKKRLHADKIDNYAVISLSGSQIHANLYGDTLTKRGEATIQTTLGSIQKRVSIMASGLTTEQVQTLSTVPKLTKHVSADRTKQTAKEISSFVMTIVLYFFMITYSSIVSQEIVAEKGTKIMEVVLSSIKGSHYFIGKIFGMALVMITHFAIYAVTGVAMMRIPQVHDIFKKGSIGFETIKNIDFRVVLFVGLGIFFYMLLSAFAGSLVSKIEDAGKAASPIVFLIIITFVLSMNSFGSEPSSLLKSLSFIPFFSPILAPSYMIGGYLTPALSYTAMGILALSDVLLFSLLAKLYPKLMLQTDSVSPLKAVSSAFKN
ncbi:MAG: ABC transporter permease [Limosilactobacillus sp.]|uniref:ABC transporter permease n=1 Tax=Limosilactobacillus sp. TaxID=2773925 RepID=UPI0026FD7FE8|nr:ABC transporter permease [Limosilactobacillus sp.]